MYIKQKQLENLKKSVKPGLAVIVYGPRRCGKTTLLKHYLKQETPEALYVSGEDITVQDFLSSRSVEKLKDFIGKNTLLVIDEAQKVPDIGLNIKLIVDHLPDTAVIATGSSSFDLARQMGEPLTGRKTTLQMFPLSLIELSAAENSAQTAARLENRLVYGMYPEVVLMRDNAQKQQYLREICASYLYKDILELDSIRHSDKITDLLQCLAFQLGKEVSVTELGTQLGMSKNTVDRYLDLLQKAFVVFKLRGFSRNLRKEISKNARYYFYDTGIRNALINNFNTLNLRDDVGGLWENFVIVERMKKREYLRIPANTYFWRTYDHKEIDLVEEREGKLWGYEVKWSPRRIKPIKDWLEAYPNARLETIHQENYLEFLR